MSGRIFLTAVDFHGDNIGSHCHSLYSDCDRNFLVYCPCSVLSKIRFRIGGKRKKSGNIELWWNEEINLNAEQLSINHLFYLLSRSFAYKSFSRQWTFGGKWQWRSEDMLADVCSDLRGRWPVIDAVQLYSKCTQSVIKDIYVPQ